jgi:hypothetical protein
MFERLPRFHDLMVLNSYLEESVWLDLWKTTSADTLNARSLLRYPAPPAAVSMIVETETRYLVIKSFLSRNRITDEQFTHMCENALRGPAYFKSARDTGEAYKAQPAPEVNPHPEAIQSALCMYLADNFFSDHELRVMRWILDLELDRLGSQAWETALTLMSGLFEGTVEDLLTVSEIL